MRFAFRGSPSNGSLVAIRLRRPAMPQTEEPVLYRVQPDRPPAPPPDVGVHSWPVGSYMPMGFYRPVPIVRFTGAMVVQSLANVVLHGLLYALPGALTVGACAVVALVLAWRAFAGWLGEASRAWKVATAVALALNLLLVSLASLAPSRTGEDPPQLPDGLSIGDHFSPGERWH
jgi:hypothetical protein